MDQRASQNFLGEETGTIGQHVWGHQWKSDRQAHFFHLFPTSRVRRSSLNYSALKLPLLAHATWPRSYPCRCLWYGTKYNGGRTQWPDTTWYNDRNLHATCQACRHSSLCQCNTCKVFNREHFHHHPIPSNFITSSPHHPFPWRRASSGSWWDQCEIRACLLSTSSGSLSYARSNASNVALGSGVTIQCWSATTNTPDLVVAMMATRTSAMTYTPNFEKENWRKVRC